MKRELPARPDIEQLKHQAKDLLKSYKSGEPAAVERMRQNHPRWLNAPAAEAGTPTLRLGDAQLVIAREYGFESWPKLKAAVEDMLISQGDPAMLRLVLTNLLSNALKYSATRESARIEIGASNQNGELVVFVRDNGVGFDPAYVHKLFGVFQRLHAPSEFEGTGIGLAIVRKAVERMNGIVGVESNQPAGSRFWVELKGGK